MKTINKLFLFFLILFPVLAFASNKVAFVGDSITFGYGLQVNQRYSDVVRDMLGIYGKRIQVINKGQNFQASDDAKNVVLGLVANEKPDIVVIGTGICDAAYSYDPERTKANFDTMIQTLLNHNVKVIIGKIEPGHICPNYVQSFLDLYKHIDDTYHVNTFPLLTTEILQHFVLDHVHPNAVGNQMIAEELLLVILPLLK